MGAQVRMTSQEVIEKLGGKKGLTSIAQEAFEELLASKVKNVVEPVILAGVQANRWPSQNAAAEELGIDPSELSHLAVRMPRMRVAKIQRILGCLNLSLGCIDPTPKEAALAIMRFTLNRMREVRKCAGEEVGAEPTESDLNSIFNIVENLNVDIESVDEQTFEKAVASAMANAENRHKDYKTKIKSHLQSTEDWSVAERYLPYQFALLPFIDSRAIGKRIEAAPDSKDIESEALGRGWSPIARLLSLIGIGGSVLLFGYLQFAPMAVAPILPEPSAIVLNPNRSIPVAQKVRIAGISVQRPKLSEGTSQAVYLATSKPEFKTVNVDGWYILDHLGHRAEFRGFLESGFTKFPCEALTLSTIDEDIVLTLYDNHGTIHDEIRYKVLREIESTIVTFPIPHVSANGGNVGNFGLFLF